MNLAEFKAWLEGYSASFKDGAPSQEQWAVISKKLSGVIAPFATQPAIPKLPPIGEPWLDHPTLPKVWYETKIISDDRPMMQSWNSAAFHS